MDHRVKPGGDESAKVAGLNEVKSRAPFGAGMPNSLDGAMHYKFDPVGLVVASSLYVFE
jgi:hypothetical protein